MNHKGFHHLSWNDRLTMEKMLKTGCSKKQIASALGVCIRTIYYELKRGSCLQLTSKLEIEERYCPETAERKYREYLSAKGAELKIGKDRKFAEYIEHRIIEDHYSPGAVLAEVREARLFQTSICESTLYNYIYGGQVFLYLGPEHLHEKGRRRYRERDKEAARPPAGESIERRPLEIWRRESFGHWEMDSVMGCQDSHRALIVLTERFSRMGIVLPVHDHTAESVVQALNALERKMGKNFYKIFKTITVDNGSEFADCNGIETAHRRRGKRTKLYYCHPYSPHERGSNENMNRMIRRFFPKGTNFDEVCLADIQKAENWINNYPRRILDWKSARQVYEEQLAAIIA